MPNDNAPVNDDPPAENPVFIKNYGLFWKRDDVAWGLSARENQGQGILGDFWGKPKGNPNANPVNFINQIGIYALYNICGNRKILDTRDVGTAPAARKGHCQPYGKNDELVYCGFSGREEGQERALFYRIRQHQQPAKELYGKWNQFSWFGIGNLEDENGFLQGGADNEEMRPDFLKQIEAVVIATSRPVENEKVGDFRGAQEYLLHIPD